MMPVASGAAASIPTASPTAAHSVLLICHTYPPVLGGSEIEAQRVCAALRARGHSVEVVCSGGPPMPRQERWTDPYGTPVRIFGQTVRPRLRDLTYAVRTAWHLLTHSRKYDIVYFLMTGVHLAVALPAAGILRKPVVMKFSGSNEIRKLMHLALGRLELRLLRRWASRVMVLNDGMLAEAAEAGFARDRVSWMPNPVDTDQFAPADPGLRAGLRRELGLPADAPVVAFLGRLAPEKDLPVLLSAFSRVITSRPEAVLLLIGDGPDRGSLQAQAEQLGIAANVRFTGRVEVERVPPWLQAADVFALVSRLEGFPCSLVEAMAAALPAVVSDIPANRQLIAGGIHGYVTPCGNAAAIAAAMLHLLDDPALRNRMGEAARAHVVNRYSTAKIAARYEELFADVLQTRTSP